MKTLPLKIAVRKPFWSLPPVASGRNMWLFEIGRVTMALPGIRSCGKHIVQYPVGLLIVHCQACFLGRGGRAGATALMRKKFDSVNFMDFR